MKINTDGVLLGAMATAYEPKRILDIGTGTGVIALMLAQRFTGARIDAVEIDGSAAATAAQNFSASKFADRLRIYHSGFEEFFNGNPEVKYDLIVSNPPFYINSLKSPDAERSAAKHADPSFFERLINDCPRHLSPQGLLWVVLPIETSLLVQDIALDNQLFVNECLAVKSYPGSEPHRHIIAFSSEGPYLSAAREFVIYSKPKIYSDIYVNLLKDFFTIF